MLSKNPVVYTGAVVFLEQYSAIVKCDLREIGGAVLIHSDCAWIYHPKPHDMDAVTHTLADPAGAAYVSRDKKVILAPAECCIGPRR